MSPRRKLSGLNTIHSEAGWLSRVTLALWLGGCTGTVGAGSGQGTGTGAGSGAGTDGQMAGTGNTGTGSGGAGGITNPVSGPPIINYAMTRLTNLQYLNTVHDLFPGVTFTDPQLPNENIVGGFTNAANGQTATALLIDNLRVSAESIATAAQGRIATVLPCQATATATAAEDTCAHSFISDFVKRAFRRPVTTDESTRLFAFYKAQRASGDFPSSISALIQVVLQAPPFLYRLETGVGPQNGGLVALTSHEMASRLSYFFTNSMPDPTLVQAADQNALTTADQVETQARRLLKDPRARAAVAKFHYEWLKFAKLESPTKDTKAFPSFTPAIAKAMRDATVQFVDHEFWDNDSLSALLTDAHGYVNDALAPYYGVAAPGSAVLKLVSLDPTQRAGILTQPGLLTALAGPVNDSPVKRGVLVLDSFLCNRPPPPPAGVSTMPPVADSTAPMTTRQRFVAQHEQGTCASCHVLIDGVGFSFENYDAVGAWRTSEFGLPVDAGGKLIGTDVDGQFTGAVALAQQLAQSRRVAQCVTYGWLRYSLGLDTTQMNLPTAQAISDQFWSAGGTFSGLLVSIARSDYFRSLKVGN